MALFFDLFHVKYCRLCFCFGFSFACLPLNGSPFQMRPHQGLEFGGQTHPVTPATLNCPLSRVNMRLASCMVVARWATMSVVRPCMSLWRLA